MNLAALKIDFVSLGKAIQEYEISLSFYISNSAFPMVKQIAKLKVVTRK